MLFLHGLWMSGIEAQLFRNRLESHHGFRTHVFRYPTHHETMAVVLERLAGVVADLQATQLHLVGHSLGGVITLRFLETQAASLPPGRVVLLAAPVQGSLAATRMEHFGLARSLVGPLACEELVGRRERRWNGARELGVIAGDQSFGLGRFIAMFDEPNDGTVALRETELEGCTDRLVLPVSHMGMLLSSRVADECAGFLSSGHFGLRS